MINCIHSMHNHAPFKQGTEHGVKISMAKRAIIGLIVAAALAVGVYYLNMASNAFNYPPNVHFGMSVTSSVLVGLCLLVGTAGWVFQAKVERNGPEAQVDPLGDNSTGGQTL